MAGEPRRTADVVRQVWGPRPARPQAKVWPERIETFLAAIVVVMMTTPGLLLLGASEDPAVPENPAFRLYWVVPYLIIIGLTVFRAKLLIRFWAPLGLALALVGWAYASKYWSIDDEVTSRRVNALAMTTLFGFYLGAAFDYRRFVRLMAMSFLFLAVGSLVLAVAMPRYGLDGPPNGGDWRGLWSEKNTLALFMVVGGLAALSAIMELRRAWWLWSGMFVLSAFLLLMSRGKTALLCFALVVALTGALWLMRRGSIAFVLTLWSMVTATALLGFLTWQAPGVLLAAVGKDATLTGRTQIWTAVLDQVALHPLTGFGFAAFWERTSVPALIVRKQTGWVVPTAHNGWLDLLVQVGWIGVGLFAAVFLITIVAVIARTARTREYFGALYLTLFGVFSVSESFLEQHNSLMWVLFVTVLTQAFAPVTRRDQASAPSRAKPAAPWTLARGTEVRT